MQAIWTRKLTTTGKQKGMMFPKELTDNLGWNLGDTLLITMLSDNTISVVRIDGAKVPDRILQEQGVMPKY